MKPPRIGAIDCDIHPALPALSSLLPYLSDHWREMALQSGLHELETVNYPPGAPLTARQDWRPAQGKAASALAQVTAQALDP
ncbi:MAG: amidohydrolase, partial [Hyphomicrobiales bacterium]|nr:amidohydrolase [Hyphomicrobiales bacterium]